MAKRGPKPRPVAERFAEKTVPTDGGCLEWTGTRFTNGYGMLGVGGKMLRAHRVAHELFIGPIPDGLHVLHSCDNPPCVNPAHLRTGTRIDNMQDKALRGRNTNSNKTHCPQGHEYSQDNTALDADGKRHCRVCRRAQGRAYLSRKRSQEK